ncbi:MAG: pyridoxamine 5'-phosphate oxidase [Bdellovibrionia bacterium]
MKNTRCSPIERFTEWYEDARASHDPCLNSMTLATSNASGHPSARIVLLKGVSESGFVFYTNYLSRKSKEISENPFAALVFYWPTLERQVRVEGELKKVSAQESDEYFATRPRGSQLGAWASLQSQPLPDRKTLEDRVQQITDRYEGADVPRPENWGGFRLKPTVIEFWQGKADRLHDRERYQRKGDQWELDQLFP